MTANASSLPAELADKQQKMRRQAYFMGLVALVMAGFGVYLVAAGALPTQYNLVMGERAPGLTAPEGLEVRVFQTGLAAPRWLLSHPQQPVLFVAERGAGRVIALKDEDGDSIADGPITVAEGLATPTGMALYEDWLYIAEANQVIRVRLDANFQETAREVVVADLPVGRNPNEVESNQHALLIHNEELYISVSASCADCEDTDSRRAAVLVFDLDGSNERIFAGGLYQVLGLAVNPITGQIWASNQGRPKMDSAPETIYALQNGDTAGFPACIVEQAAPEDKFQGADCNAENLARPVLTTNPQGNIATLLFWGGASIPSDYQGGLLYTLHGGVVGGGRSGEQVEFGLYHVPMDAAGAIAGQPEMLIEGFWVSEEPGDYVGRPFGLAAWPDGTLFVSDDASGAIYQIKARP